VQLDATTNPIDWRASGTTDRRERDGTICFPRNIGPLRRAVVQTISPESLTVGHGPLSVTKFNDMTFVFN
jgi:hypothetical protein